MEKDPPHASNLYKSLIFRMIENHPNDPTKLFLERNLASFLEKNTKIPINFVVEPFIKGKDS